MDSDIPVLYHSQSHHFLAGLFKLEGGGKSYVKKKNNNQSITCGKTQHLPKKELQNVCQIFLFFQLSKSS